MSGFLVERHRAFISESAESSSCLCSSGCHPLRAPSDCPNSVCTVVSVSRTTAAQLRGRLPPMLAAAGIAAPPTVDRPRSRAVRPGTRQKVHCGGSRSTPKFPSAWVRVGETAHVVQPREAYVQTSTIARMKLIRRHDRSVASLSSVSSTSCRNPSFSSNVPTGSSPP